MSPLNLLPPERRAAAFARRLLHREAEALVDELLYTLSPPEPARAREIEARLEELDRLIYGRDAA